MVIILHHSVFTFLSQPPLVKLFHIPPKIPGWPGFCSAHFAALPSILARFWPWRPANLSADEAEDYDARNKKGFVSLGS